MELFIKTLNIPTAVSTNNLKEVVEDASIKMKKNKEKHREEHPEEYLDKYKVKYKGVNV